MSESEATKQLATPERLRQGEPNATSYRCRNATHAFKLAALRAVIHND